MDERPFARTIAEQYGTDHSEYLYENPEKQIGEMLPAIIEAFDEPFADSSVIPNFMIAEAARKFVTVALSGTGGDELFAGYERYRGALAAERYRHFPRLLRRGLIDPLIRSLPEIRAAGLWIDRAKRFVEGSDLPLPRRYQRFLAAFDEREKANVLHPDVLDSLRKAGSYSTPLAMDRVEACEDSLGWMLRTDMHTYLPDDELRKTDRLSMWHSLEVRVPFLDHKVVEFAASIPTKYKLSGMTKKFVLLKSLEGRLPASILTRKKQGFSIPLSDWLRGPLRNLLRDALGARTVERQGLLSSRKVSSLLRDHEEGRENHEVKLWTLFTLVLWYDHYFAVERSQK